MGGVEEGQRFSVPFNSPGLRSGFAGAAVPRAPVPVGHWKVRYSSCTCAAPCVPISVILLLTVTAGWTM